MRSVEVKCHAFPPGFFNGETRHRFGLTPYSLVVAGVDESCGNPEIGEVGGDHRARRASVRKIVCIAGVHPHHGGNSNAITQALEPMTTTVVG